ncbi:hypothetical protein DFQ30_003077, partial [Apophysomyces sp. BC1015]
DFLQPLGRLIPVIKAEPELFEFERRTDDELDSEEEVYSDNDADDISSDVFQE